MKEETWFEKLGYKQNPFMIKPYAFEDTLRGYAPHIRKVNAGLKRGRVVFIEGAYGVGKTSVLKQIINEFKGRRKLIYYSANRGDGGVDFDALIHGRAGFFGKLFGVKPKELILMIDEAQKLTQKDCENIERLADEGYFKSIVLVSDDMIFFHRVCCITGKVGVYKEFLKVAACKVIDRFYHIIRDDILPFIFQPVCYHLYCGVF